MSQANLLLSEHLSPSVSIISGRPATTSREVAQFFDKRHDDVLKSVRVLCDSTPQDFRLRNFAESSYINEQGKEQPMFILYRDGFMLLVMGYTGKRALAVKLAYIEAFNTLEARLAGDVKALPDDSQPEADALPDPVTTATPSSTADRAPLRSVVNAWARLSGQPFDACWSQLKAAFRITDIRSLPKEWIDDAIAWVQAKIDALPRTLPPAAPATPPSAPTAPAVVQPILSAELDRCMAEFEVLARSVEDMERLMVRVRRLASPITSAAARAMAGSGTTDRTSLEGLLEEYLDRSRRLAMELVPCARLGINVMRDLAQAQGR